LDHETWVYDLEAANSAGTPSWFKSYSMREEYQLQDLSPKSMAALSANMKSNQTAFDTYLRYAHVQALFLMRAKRYRASVLYIFKILNRM
jgi:hypothetical protein